MISYASRYLWAKYFASPSIILDASDLNFSPREGGIKPVGVNVLDKFGFAEIEQPKWFFDSRLFLVEAPLIFDERRLI